MEAADLLTPDAGFEAVRFEEVHEAVLYGHDIDAALEFVCGYSDTSSALAGMSRDDAARAVDRLRETLEGHYGDAEGWPSSRAPG